MLSFIDTFNLMPPKNSHIVKTSFSRYIYKLLVLAETYKLVILAIESDFKFIKQCFYLVERVISIRALTLKELHNQIRNIRSILLIETFKFYYRSFLL